MSNATRLERSGKRRLAVGILVMVLCCTGRALAAGDLGLIEVGRLGVESSSWLVLDARPRAAWAAGHLPGALSFSWEDHTRTDPAGARYRVPPAQDLATLLGALGINRDTPVVVYGDADSSWGGEGWVAWVLTWLGHRAPVRLLAGGIQAWKDHGLPLREGMEPQPVQTTYRVELRPEVLRTAADLASPAVGERLIDTRSTLEWLRGRLPGAVHLNWKDLFTGHDRRPLSPTAYRQLLAEEGIGDGQVPVFYCTGGIRSAYAWLVHRLAGAGPAANFEGGTEAWERRSATP